MHADCSKMIGYDAKNGQLRLPYLYRDRIFKFLLFQLTAIAIFPISVEIAFFKFRYPN